MKPFENYLRLLIDLHQAMVDGNEELSDAIREKMDQPWWELSIVEQSVIEWVSRGLYGDFEYKE